MTRLQKKCLVVSLCCHGVLMGAIVVTAAFRSEPVVSSEQVLNLVSFPRILDRPNIGGEPAPTVPRPTPPAAHSDPAPTLPQTPARSAPVEPHPLPHEAETPAPTRRTAPRPVQDPPKVATTKSAPEIAPKSHVITPDFTKAPASTTSTRPASRNTTPSTSSQTESQTEKSRRLQQEMSSVIASLTSSLNSKEPASKVVALPGLGGGEAFVNYRTAIFNYYYHAWITPDDTTQKRAVADVKIVVSRNGDIISSDFVSKSGDAAIDRSVQRALDAVKSLPPFPAGATDTERTFIIRFNLEAKESAG